MNILYGYLFSFLYVFGVLLVVSIIRNLCNAKHNDIYRKLVHIFIAFTWLPLYQFLHGTWHFIVIPLVFVFITMMSTKYSLIKIVERDNGNRKDYGIVHYAVSMTILCVLANIHPASLIPCGIGVFALSFGDGCASLFGQAFYKMNVHITKSKTLIGSLACYIFTICGIFILNLFIPFSFKFSSIFIIGIVATLLEIVGGRYDNYSVPFGATMMATLIGIGGV